MADLSLNLCGVHLKNPIIAASGTFGFGREYDELYDIMRVYKNGDKVELTAGRSHAHV